MNHEDIKLATADQEPEPEQLGEESQAVAVSPGEESQAPAPAGPKPLIAGSFALFVRPDGSVILSLFTEQTGQQQQKIPSFVVKQARRQSPALAAILDAGKQAA